jgi:hypothetical protein
MKIPKYCAVPKNCARVKKNVCESNNFVRLQKIGRLSKKLCGSPENFVPPKNGARLPNNYRV